MLERLAKEDYERATRKAFWRKLSAWFTGKSNQLLPYDEVRQHIPIKGQRYLGLRTVPIKKIVGSMGRYHDFDRAFLPIQTGTMARWVSIGRAHYEAISLPPVDLYKIGEVYFVKDGNHRVSVGRELGQIYIDAYVTEIDVPISLTEDLQVDDLARKQAYARFVEAAQIDALRPEADLELTMPDQYPRLAEHLRDHRWYLGEQRQHDIPYAEAFHSWYDNVYLPMVEQIEAQGLKKRFPKLTKADLYLLVSEYQGHRRAAYVDDESLEHAIARFQKTFDQNLARQMVNALKQSAWLDGQILQQDREAFLEKTRLDVLRPGAAVELTLPGKYEKLYEHISVHRWYLGEGKKQAIPYEEAVVSWYDNVYLPLVEIIREQGTLEYFPNRTEADLYLWLLDHRAHLEATLGMPIAPEAAATDLATSQGRATLGQIVGQAGEKLLDAVTPDSLEAGPAPGQWRRERLAFRHDVRMFADILVPLGSLEEDWRAFEQALIIARHNQARLHGLHVVTSRETHTEARRHAFGYRTALREKFTRLCREAGVQGELAFETSDNITRKICDRAQWIDLIVVSLNHPPARGGVSKLTSGFRTMLRRSGRPVLAIPSQTISRLDRVVLAYDGSPKADEGLYIASVLLAHWGAALTVLAIEEGQVGAASLARARSYLEHHHLQAEYALAEGPVADTIYRAAQERAADLIIIGGYGHSPVIEIVLGSAVDQLLQQAQIPLLISN